jgi:COP9 signalosome complex subunit 12
MCHPDSTHNQTLILTHLIPCRLASQRAIPSEAFLRRYPELYHLYYGVLSAIQHGRLKEFDEALEASEDDLVKKRVFLTLERGRQICLRNVLRKTWRNLEQEDKTKVTIESFRVGIALRSGTPVADVDIEEVECLLTNMIANVSNGPSYEQDILVFF